MRLAKLFFKLVTHANKDKQQQENKLENLKKEVMEGKIGQEMVRILPFSSTENGESSLSIFLTYESSRWTVWASFGPNYLKLGKKLLA